MPERFAYCIVKRRYINTLPFLSFPFLTDDLSRIFRVSPLLFLAIMKKEAEFVWTDECQIAFDTLRKRLTRATIPALPTDDGPYTLDTDASDYGLGAVRSQRQDGVERVISYASRALSTSERWYETTRKELLAVVVGLKHFRQYLFGRHFVIRTDPVSYTHLTLPTNREV